MSSPETNKWWILITPTGEELVFESYDELKSAVDSPGALDDLRRKSEPALKLSMPEIAQDLKSVPPGPTETDAAAPIVPGPAPTGATASDVTVQDATVKDAPVIDSTVKDDATTAATASKADAKDDAPPSSDESPISLSDIALAASEVKMPSLPPGIARPSQIPAARAASRPPPPVPTRKSAVPPPMPIASKAPSSKPPPQHRSAAWEHDDASAPMIPTGYTPLPLPSTSIKPAAKPSAPPPPRPRPPPRPPVVEEVEAEPAAPSVRASLPAPAAAAPASSSRSWMVGAALIAAGTFAYVVSPSRDRQAQPPPIASAEPSATASPASPDSLLADFDAAITDGDLDHASLLADKLGTLAEKDPRVLVRQARVAVIKADRAWLASRLVVGDAGAATADPALAELVAKSSALTEAALAAAPTDTQAILARIDALRLAGNLDATEPLVSQVVAKRAEPDVAYTIGARDFVAAKPQLLPAPPAGVADLQVAAAASPRLARPQALLAYVLAERGELDAAREMSKGLDTPAHPNPLLDPLRAYIASRPALPTPLTTNRPAYVTAPTASTAPTSPAPSTTAAASAHPTEVEAPEEPAAPVVPQTAAGLTALGDAARAKGDRGAAQTYYTRALAVNPGFYAAMLGLADIEWETGARAKAVERYTQIKERFPNAPARVQERLSQ